MIEMESFRMHTKAEIYSKITLVEETLLQFPNKHRAQDKNTSFKTEYAFKQETGPEL